MDSTEEKHGPKKEAEDCDFATSPLSSSWEMVGGSEDETQKAVVKAESGQQLDADKTLPATSEPGRKGEEGSPGQSNYMKEDGRFDSVAWSKVLEVKMERWNECRTQNFESSMQPLKHLPETFFDNVDSDVLQFPSSLSPAMRKSVYKAAKRLQMRVETAYAGKYKKVHVYRTERPGRLGDKPRSKKDFSRAILARLEMWMLGKVTKPQDLEIPLPELDGADFTHNTSTGLTFPPTLNADQRRATHMAALKLGLFHASMGSGKDRRVIISKTEDFEGLAEATLPEKNRCLYDPSVEKNSFSPFWSCSGEWHGYRERLEQEIDRNLQEMLTGPLRSKSQQCAPLEMYCSVEERGYEVVESEASLRAMVSHLDDVDIFGFDIEFHTYRSYYGITCLMQISTLEKNFIVDVLGTCWDYVALLRPAFADPQKVKIGHDVKGSDAPTIFRDFGIIIVNLFDTHEAARELQYTKSGLAAVLLENGLPNDVFEKIQSLKERFQVSDWRARPLPEDALVYAALDSHYLIPLYLKLRQAILATEDEQESPQAAPIDRANTLKGNEDQREEKNADLDSNYSFRKSSISTSKKDFVGELEDIEEDEVLIPSEVREEDTDDEELWEGWGEHPDDKKPQISPETATSHPDSEDIEEQARPADWPRGESFSGHIAQPRPIATLPAGETPHLGTEISSAGQQRLREFMIRCQKGVSKLWRPKKPVGPLDYKKEKQFKYAKRSKKLWNDISTAVFAEIYQWRDRRARELDDGLHYICSTQTLVEIARKAPEDLTELRSIAQPLSPALTDGQNDLGESLLQAVKRAKQRYKSEVQQHEKNQAKLQAKLQDPCGDVGEAEPENEGEREAAVFSMVPPRKVMIAGGFVALLTLGRFVFKKKYRRL